MTLNSLSTNNISYTTADDVHEKPYDTIKNYIQTIKKTINIKLKKLLLMMILNRFKKQEK